jgi:Uncharacterized protein conserved in bacteria (DUF2147)
MRWGFNCVLLVSTLLCFASVVGQGPPTAAQLSSTSSPVGRWRTVDDATGRVKALVVIWAENGKLYGRIEKLFDPPPDYPDPKCVQCEGELKNQRVIGMRILWDLKNNGDEWSGGRVLDPNNGKSYRCYITLEDGGKRLKVRGFIGFSFFGRTQHWLRDQ